MTNILSVEQIASRILQIRGRRVILDQDLAKLYGVSTKVLNQAVKRNKSRFPEDFMFKLTKPEKEKVVTICDHLYMLKFSYQLPYAFTEQGIAMLSSVLNSEKAVRVNIKIMRAFVRLSYILAHHKGIEMKLEELEGKVGRHDNDIHDIFEAIRQLIGIPQARRVIKGFSKE